MIERHCVHMLVALLVSIGLVGVPNGREGTTDTEKETQRNTVTETETQRNTDTETKTQRNTDT